MERGGFGLGFCGSGVFDAGAEVYGLLEEADGFVGLSEGFVGEPEQVERVGLAPGIPGTSIAWRTRSTHTLLDNRTTSDEAARSVHVWSFLRRDAFALVGLHSCCRLAADGGAMQAHRVETTIQPGGTLVVHGLPVPDGTHVEVIVLVKEIPVPAGSRYPLRGTPYRYDEPFDPVTPKNTDP